MYSRIVADWYGGDPPHNYGTAEHMAEMFQICASAEVFEKKGGKNSSEQVVPMDEEVARRSA
jgi:hypothetical protein